MVGMVKWLGWIIRWSGWGGHGHGSEVSKSTLCLEDLKW